MGLILSTILDLVRDISATIREVFEKHGCSECGCENYNDSGFFEEMQQRSNLSSYADDMVDSGMIGQPLSCGCGHLREKHKNLQMRLLTTDAMPNGGVVHVVMKQRAELARRQRRGLRFSRNGSANEGVRLNEDGIQIVDMETGNGRVIKSGDEILMHYIAFVKGSKEAFDSSRNGIDMNNYDKDKALSDMNRDDQGVSQDDLRDALRITVGGGTVIEGLDRGLIGARVGGKRRIAIPARLAFGKNEVGGHYNADVEFIVEILAILSTWPKIKKKS